MSVQEQRRGIWLELCDWELGVSREPVSALQSREGLACAAALHRAGGGEGVEGLKTTWRSSGFTVMWEDQVGGKKG